MSTPPRVSILTPAYNHAAFIESTIASVQAQTITDWEMLVLDDGSTDGTPDAAEAIGDERVRVFREPHRGLNGLAETYDRGLAEATAPLIAVLEGDDLWDPEKLERQLQDFADPSVVLSGGRMTIAIEGQPDQLSPLKLPPPDVLQNCPVGRAGLEMLRPLTLTFTFALTVVMRAEALRRIGGFQQPSDLPIVDYPTFLRMSLEGAWRFHDEPLGTWRRHGDSTTISSFPTIFEGCYRHAAVFFERFGPRLGATREDAKRLDREWREVQVHRLELAGRMRAADGRFRTAGKLFGRASQMGASAKSRLLMTAASALCLLSRSPEPVFRAAGRNDWREDWKLVGADPLVDPAAPPESFAQWPFRPPASPSP